MNANEGGDGSGTARARLGGMRALAIFVWMAGEMCAQFKSTVPLVVAPVTVTALPAVQSVAVNGGIMTVVPDRNRSKEQKDPLEAHRRVRKRVPPPGRVLPDRREKLRERAERTERDADREQDPGRG